MQEQWYSPSVVVNIALVVVGLLYAGFACSQWIAIKRQAKFARRTLRAIRRQANIAANVLALTHRPKIKIRGFTINSDVFEPGVDGFTIDLGYEVVNYGGTEAIISDSCCTVYLRHINEQLPMVPEYERGALNHIVKVNEIFLPGKSYSFSKKKVVSSDDTNFAIGSLVIYALGYIDYRGSIGNYIEPLFVGG